MLRNHNDDVDIDDEDKTNDVEHTSGLSMSTLRTQIRNKRLSFASMSNDNFRRSKRLQQKQRACLTDNVVCNIHLFPFAHFILDAKCDLITNTDLLSEYPHLAHSILGCHRD